MSAVLLHTMMLPGSEGEHRHAAFVTRPIAATDRAEMAGFCADSFGPEGGRWVCSGGEPAPMFRFSHEADLLLFYIRFSDA